MTWESHGTVWHIDHIIPCVSFNLLNEDEIYKCYNYGNLQPLSVADNLSKGNKMPDGSYAKKSLTSLRNRLSLTNEDKF